MIPVSGVSGQAVCGISSGHHHVNSGTIPAWNVWGLAGKATRAVARFTLALDYEHPHPPEDCLVPNAWESRLTRPAYITSGQISRGPVFEIGSGCAFYFSSGAFERS